MRKLVYRETQRSAAKGRRRHAVNAERTALPVRKGDTVRVLRGDDKGREARYCACTSRRGASSWTA